MIGYHAFSGCDSKSAFVGHGKGFKLLKQQQPFRNAMSMLGRSFITNDEILQKGEVAIGILYGHKEDDDVNKIRLSMFG